MSRILVFASSGPAATAVATELTAAGLDAWATSDFVMATEMVRQHPQITCLVIEANRDAVPICLGLQAERPDLKIVGLQMGDAADCLECGLDCQLLPDVESLLPVLQGIVC